MKAKQWLIVLCVLGVVMNYSAVAKAEWNFGVGTGLFRLNVDGDIGFHTNLQGPVELDVDLDPDDIDDLMETAFGLAGYATDGTWMIQYSLSQLELEGDSRTTLSDGSLYSDLNFEMMGGELTVGFPVAATDRITLRAHCGVRYTKHDWDSEVTVVEGGTTTRLNRDIDESWADILFGMSADVVLAEKWTWNSLVNAGFGGSEGTYLVSTGVSWRFFEHWSAALYGKYTAVEYENEEEGDPDWYLYDVDEFGAGLSVLFHW